ncbi:MAG TPA: ABC transporter permease, partial [Vicinamibacteria bacterium]|nr:ABC transporter permease [Vicinamibacteria bacterium]
MLKTLIRRLTEPFRAALLDRDAQDELAHHVGLAVARKVEAGLDPREARRQARLELGDPESTREELRAGRMGFRLEMFLKDASLAARTLRKRRAFTAVCVLTIALGVGASTALFALVDAVVFRPLPLPDPGALLSVYDTNLARSVSRTGITSGNLIDWRQRMTRLEGIAGYYTMGRTLTMGLESEVVLTSQVTEDFFGLLRTRAEVGRVFTPEETRASLFNSAAAPVGADPVAVLSHGLWQRRFGKDPAAVGQTLIIDRRPFRIVGV